MGLRVLTAGGEHDVWRAVGDERTWFDYTAQDEDGELLVFLHTFRRVRESAGRHQDRLLWKHHTTKLARRYARGEWRKVLDVRTERPPYGFELVPKRVTPPRERR